MLPPLAHVRFAAREGVVETKHLLIGLHQPIHQMRAKEAGTTGDQIASRGGRHEQQETNLSILIKSDTLTATPEKL